jgi:acyl carrier protein
MIPSAFSLVESFPLTPNGKVDRAALPEPDLSFPIGRQAYTAPRTRIEETLRRIWADLLAIDNVGVDDNFFTLGGHSLIATRLLSRLRDAFRVELPLRAIFDHPTIAELARAVEEAQEGTRISKAPAVARLPREQHSVSVDAAGNVDLSGVKTITKEPLQDSR